MMQRPRNRQGRGISQNEGGRGGRGRGRGGRRFDDWGPANVPNINQVIPGGFVSIVLKADQPTGREVQGVVADVLTSGNHPRGIKVRLVDGKVGRVQRMITEEEVKTGLDRLGEQGRNSEYRDDQYDTPQPIGRMRPRDVREEEHMEVPTSEYSLGDFLPSGHPLLQENATQRSTSASENLGALSSCPVCGEFEGDEAAVSYHVNRHFE